MTYKNRLIFLLSLIAVLSLLYTGSIIYYSDIGRNTTFAWLDSRTAERVTRIVINTEWDQFELLRKNNRWFIAHNDNEYPARRLRAEDFLRILTTRADWPVRSNSASTHERFGLDEGASRITVYTENVMQLDLLIGIDDFMGQETYFRKAGSNEVRSGDNSIKAYLSNLITGWYNFRLIYDSEGGSVDISTVQRLSVFNGEETQVFTRRNRGWIISGIEVINASHNDIENYIRTIINLEGDRFIDDVSSDSLNSGRIILEFGNGRVVTIRLGEPDETGRLNAHVSGSDYIYSIPAWSANRLFRDAESFEM
jgi:hypothetical protein